MLCKWRQLFFDYGLGWKIEMLYKDSQIFYLSSDKYVAVNIH